MRPQALEAVMRVRCSQGLDVQSYTGHFYRMPNNPTDVCLPAIDSDKSILTHLALTEKLQPGTECYLQVREGATPLAVHTHAYAETQALTCVCKGSAREWAPSDTAILSFSG